MKTIRPLLNLISLLCIDYHPKRFLGRIMTFWTLFSNLLIILVIELLRKWVIAQLSILIALSAITIIFSLPKMIYKTTIGTELGFIIISILFLVLGLLQNSDGASNSDLRLILSWIGVGTNIAIVLFHIIVRIIEFFRLRKEKKRGRKRKKRLEVQNSTNYNKTHASRSHSTLIQHESKHDPNISFSQSFHERMSMSKRTLRRGKSVDMVNFMSNSKTKNKRLSNK